MAGLSHAVEVLLNAHRKSLLHLAAINPYVMAAMGPPGSAPTWSVARQSSSATTPTACIPAAVTCGISAFAFQVSCFRAQAEVSSDEPVLMSRLCVLWIATDLQKRTDAGSQWCFALVNAKV